MMVVIVIVIMVIIVVLVVVVMIMMVVIVIVIMVIIVVVVVILVVILAMMFLPLLALAPLPVVAATVAAAVVATAVAAAIGQVVAKPGPMEDGSESVVKVSKAAVAVAVEPEKRVGVVDSIGPLSGCASHWQGAVGLFPGRARSTAAHKVVRVGRLEEGELCEGIALAALFLHLEPLGTLAVEDLGTIVHRPVTAADIALSVHHWLALSVLPLAIDGRIVRVGSTGRLRHQLAAERVFAAAQRVRHVPHAGWAVGLCPEEVGRGRGGHQAYHEDQTRHLGGERLSGRRGDTSSLHNF